MHSPLKQAAQWTLDVSVFHDSEFGHRIRARVLGRTGGWVDVGSIQWKGLGVPEDLLRSLCARVEAVLTEHLVTRYGVQGVLDAPCAGEEEIP